MLESMTDLFEFSHQVRTRFTSFTPKRVARSGRHAAVLVPFILEPEPAVLLTLRAAHLSSHPGQVSFPGGMNEPVDQSVRDTALRETDEEIALPARRFDIVGELSTACSKDGVLVYPIVGLAENISGSLGNPAEIAEVFTVPWDFFQRTEPEFHDVERYGLTIKIPHFYHGDRHIWGLTAMILLEALNVLDGATYEIPDYTQIFRN